LSTHPFAARAFARRPRLLSPAAAVLAGLLASQSAAAAGPPRVLSLDAAVRSALAAGPAVSGARLGVTAADALARDAARRPPARFELDAENWGSPAGGPALETTAALGWTLELGGDRGARRAAAAAGSDAARATHALARREARAAVSADFVSAWEAQERLALLRETHAAAVLTVAAARERLRAGAAPAVEVARAESEAARAAARVTLAAADLAGSFRALAANWGADSAGFDSLTLEPPAAAAVPVPGAAAAHPDAMLAVAGEREAAAAVSAAGARRMPDVDVLLGVRRFGGERMTGYVASLAVPIGAVGGGEKDAALARRERAALERAAAERRLRAGADVAATRLAAALEAWRALSDTAAPRAEEALELLLAGYRAGRFGWTDLAEGRRAAFEAREALIEAAAGVWRARVELERWTGEKPAAGEGEVTR
jgi:outer membrane protein, heavy metal efflux system